MEKIRNYEATFISKSDLENEEQEALQEKYKKIVTENGGEINDVNVWGSKNLAYEIRDYRKGFYTILDFNSKPDVVKEMDRKFKIDDDILRHLIIRVQE